MTDRAKRIEASLTEIRYATSGGMDSEYCGHCIANRIIDILDKHGCMSDQLEDQ